MSRFSFRRSARAVPAGVWALGTVSMLMDLSSEMIHSLLPVFLVSVLGVSTLAVGAIEGVAEATASILKVFSGTLSDYWGRRKPLALVGYGLAAITKPLFPLADSLLVVMTARFVDRIGKGIRGAPRDALVADITPPEQHGAAFGLRQALDTVGAVAGPLLAMALMALSGDDYRLVFWVAVIPAFAAVATLFLFVREEPAPQKKAVKNGQHVRHPWRWHHIRKLPTAFWLMVAVSVAMGLARFSEAFLILRASDLGLVLALAPLVLVVMNIVYTLSAYPAGVLSDRWGRRGLLLAGFAVLVVADGVLAAADGPVMVLAGAMLWGLHMGLTQGLLAAAVADAAPVEMTGTAFGIFHLSAGMAFFVASLLAGALWETWGAPVTFMTGGGFSALAALGLVVWRRHLPA